MLVLSFLLLFKLVKLAHKLCFNCKCGFFGMWIVTKMREREGIASNFFHFRSSLNQT